MAEWQNAPEVNAQGGGSWKDAPEVNPADNPWERGMLLPIERNRETGEYRGPVLPQIGQSLVDAFMLPGDVASGKTEMDPRAGFSGQDPATLDRAANAAAWMTPSTPASRLNQGTQLTQAQKDAAKRLQGGLKADQVPASKAQSMIDDLGKDAMALDIGPNMQQKAGGLASVPGEAQKRVFSAVENRAGQAGARVADDVAKAAGTGLPKAQMLDDITAAQMQAAKPLYDAVRSAPVPPTGNIQFVIQTPMGKRAFNQAIQAAANDGYKADGLTIGLIDYAKQALDDIASSAARAGNNNEARQAAQLARILRTEADKVVPAYKAAREAYAGPAAIKDAMEMGADIFSKKVHPAQFKKTLDGMTASEKEAALQGARTAFEEMMGNAVNDALSVRNALRKDFNRQKLELILGKSAVDDLVKAMEREIRFGQTRNVVTGNSQTAARQAAQAESAPHLRNANPPHGWFDATLRAFSAARNKLAQGRVDRANEELSKLLTAEKLPPWATAQGPGFAQKVAIPALGVQGRAALSSGGGGY